MMSKLVTTVLNRLISNKEIQELRLENLIEKSNENQVDDIIETLNNLSLIMTSINLWTSYTVNNNNEQKTEQNEKL